MNNDDKIWDEINGCWRQDYSFEAIQKRKVSAKNGMIPIRPMTLEEQKAAINLIKFLVDGCSFVSSRAFKGGTCAEENGQGFNCPSCSARIFLTKFGIELK